MKVVPLRLQPGADLRQALEAWIGEQQEQAGCAISAVGSLSVAQLRFAGAAEATVIHGELEILSLSGTLSPDGAHLQKHQPGHSGADAAGPVVAQQLHDRHRAGADAQAAQQKAAQFLQRLTVHRHQLGPAQSCFRLAEGLQAATARSLPGALGHLDAPLRAEFLQGVVFQGKELS